MSKEELLRIYSAYLPFELEIGFEADELQHKFVGLDLSREGVQLISPYGDFGRAEIEKCKPILFSLDMLTQPIEHKGNMFVPSRYWESMGGSLIEYQTLHKALNNFSLPSLPYYVINKLLEWHFNVFNLPDSAYIKKENLNGNDTNVATKNLK